jgi:hypothetical protein
MHAFISVLHIAPDTTSTIQIFNTYLATFQVGNYQFQSLEGIHDKVGLAREFSFLGTAFAFVKAFTGALGRQW